MIVIIGSVTVFGDEQFFSLQDDNFIVSLFSIPKI